MEEQNPYQSPQFDSYGDKDWQQGPRPVEVASQGKRFLNYLLDQVILYIVNSGIGFVLGFAMAASSGPDAVEDVPMLIFYAIGIGVSLCYFILFEAMFGRSIGKMATGTRVVNEDGSPPSFGQVVGRTFARFIPFEPFSFLGGNKPVGWHDSLSKTRVIVDR